jgi:putative membrane protein
MAVRRSRRNLINMFYMHNIGWGWWIVMAIVILAFWAFVIYGIAWLLHGGLTSEQQPDATPESPKAILRRRLAQGEISIEEYTRLLDTLDDQPPEHSMAA